MRSLRSFFFHITLCLICCNLGCSFAIGGGGEQQTYYVLGEALNKPEAVLTKRPLTLLVSKSEASRFVDSHRIVFSKDASTRGYYRYATWVDTPPRRFSILLLERLEEVGLFEVVTWQTSSALGDFQLSTEIIDFYHDALSRPGTVRVSLRAELIDLSNRRVVAKREFVEAVKVGSYDVEGAVKSFDTAVGAILKNMVLWLDEVVSLV